MVIDIVYAYKIGEIISSKSIFPFGPCGGLRGSMHICVACEHDSMRHMSHMNADRRTHAGRGDEERGVPSPRARGENGHPAPRDPARTPGPAVCQGFGGTQSGVYAGVPVHVSLRHVDVHVIAVSRAAPLGHLRSLDEHPAALHLHIVRVRVRVLG